MSLIQTPWTSQPPIGTQVNREKAKDLGVIYLAVANEAGQLRDVIGGGALANPGGSSIGQGGRIWTFNGAQQGNKAFTLPNGETNPNNFLICAKIRATATQAGDPGAAFGIYVSSNQSGCGVGFNSSNQVGTAWLSNAGAGIQAYSTASLNTWYSVYSNTQIGGGYYSWINGVPATTGQGGGVSNFFGGQNEIAVGAQHRSAGFLRNFTGDIEWVAIIYRPSAQITDDFSARLYRDGFPYNVFQPIPRRIFAPVSAVSDILATLNVTEGAETLASSGTVSGAAGVDGTASLTESAETLTASGNVAVGATLSQTEVAETLAASGGVTVGATLSQTESPETASSSGMVTVGGSLSQTEAAETLSASGTVVSGVVGTASINEVAETLTAAGTLAIGGTASIANASQTVTASGAIQITGAGNLIELAETLTASGIALGGITGSANLTLAAQTLSAFGTASFPTVARPSTDTSNSGWTPSTGSDLYAMLDEVSPNDADYISAASAGSVCSLGLGAVADPGTSSGQVVSYRASSSTGNGLKVELMQGGTVIATWNHATLPTTDTTYQQSLSAAECDAITDYTALSVRLTSL